MDSSSTFVISVSEVMFYRFICFLVCLSADYSRKLRMNILSNFRKEGRPLIFVGDCFWYSVLSKNSYIHSSASKLLTILGREISAIRREFTSFLSQM